MSDSQSKISNSQIAMVLAKRRFSSDMPSFEHMDVEDGVNRAEQLMQAFDLSSLREIIVEEREIE